MTLADKKKKKKLNTFYPQLPERKKDIFNALAVRAQLQF